MFQQKRKDRQIDRQTDIQTGIYIYIYIYIQINIQIDRQIDKQIYIYIIIYIYIYRQIDRYRETDRQTDSQIDRQIDIQMDGWMDEQIDRYIDGWMDGWMNRQIDIQMNGWMDGLMNRQIDRYLTFYVVNDEWSLHFQGETKCIATASNNSDSLLNTHSTDEDWTHLENKKLSEPGRQKLVDRSPVRRHKMQSYILSYYRLRKREPLIALHDNIPADLLPRWRKVRQSRATQPRYTDVPDSMTTSAVQSTFWDSDVLNC